MIFKKKNKWNSVDKTIVREYNSFRPKSKQKLLCHAPFKTLCFSHSGDVLACWYNKMFPLGKYPQDTIKSIWFSDKAKTLRNHIKNNDLSYGCYDCKRNLENRNFFAAGLSRYDFLPEQKGKYPISMDFQVSEKCNLQCIMCNGEFSEKVRHLREQKAKIQRPYDDQFYEQLKEFIPYLKEASFSGGEPFVGIEFYRIWDMIIELNPNIRLSVTTNGNVNNEKVKHYLNRLNFNITLSLDAIDSEIYKKIRIGGNLSVFLENLKYFHAYCKQKSTDFNIKTCAMQQNWHDLPKLAEFLNRLEIPFLYNTVFYPPDCSLWNLPSIQLKEILTYFRSNFVLHDDTYIKITNSKRIKDLINQIERWLNESIENEKLGINEMSLTELIQNFLNKVHEFIEKDSIGFKHSYPFSHKEISDIIHKLVNESVSEDTSIKALRYFGSAPVDRIISEFRIRDFESIKDRFLQAGRY
ncbi:MAG: radical SAM protein [Bacteroidales bacterium]|nr:radical SAM protein [Bacteroidales bacterium]